MDGVLTRLGALRRVALVGGLACLWGAPSLAAAAPSHASQPLAGAPTAAPRSRSLSAALQLGLFGILNVDPDPDDPSDNMLTQASPSFGVTPAFELDLSPIFSLGGEVMLQWVKSQPAPRHRLVLSPHLVLRLRFVLLAPGLNAEILLAGGPTLWPEDDSETEVEPALSGTRGGWSLRAAAGLGWVLDERWSLFLHAGYFASSSFGRDVWATMDGMQIGLGPRLRF